MLKQKLRFKDSLINYYRYGNGAKTLFCLHGYGEDGTSFSFLETNLAAVYTLYAIDFPFHGETEWNEKTPMSAKDLLAVFNIINTNHTKTFSLLAYSFGGRSALYLLQNFPEYIEHIVLIAPDGLRINFWYWLSTQTFVGNKLFKANMHNPKYFFFFLSIADKTNLMNKSIIKFVHHYLDDRNERILLYKRWSAMKKFKPDLSLIKKTCAENNINLHFLFGNYDRIILSKRASVFKRSKNIHITTIDAGHRLLNEAYTSQIISLLNQF